jgi:hypothetical protein
MPVNDHNTRPGEMLARVLAATRSLRRRARSGGSMFRVSNSTFVSVTIAVLLRPNAQRANLTNRVEYHGLSFRFEIVKVWELPAEQFLQGGVSLMPLAVLGRPAGGLTRSQALPAQIQTLIDRAQEEAEDELGELLTATVILASIHHEPAAAREVIRHVLNMRELPGYKFILNEGAIYHGHDLILKLGRQQLGDPTEKQVAKLKSIEDLERLDRMVFKVHATKSWDALLRVK